METHCISPIRPIDCSMNPASGYLSTRRKQSGNHSVTVLVVDDEPTIRGIAARCLAATKTHLETVRAALKREKNERARENMDIAIKIFAGEWR